MLLNGKVAIVTGASSGLGKSAALSLAKEGAKVALFARRIEKLESLKKEIEESGGQALAIKCDVTDEENVKKAVQNVIDEYSKIDILINNAGIAVRGGVHELSLEDWNKSMDINVKGIYMTSKYVVPHMIEQKYGKIVNIAFVNALIADKHPMFIRHSYNASKSAVVGLTKGMAASYGIYNITVNAVGPSLFESEMTRKTLFASEEFLAHYNAVTPLNRPGREGELNGTILYLASDMSSYTTGQCIFADGGLSIV
ncbi:MAG: short-chain dehydrogenase [Clostridiales bacterium]|nr:MAG: short-chain dehydrogenase [Clostridiales bacterium]